MPLFVAAWKRIHVRPPDFAGAVSLLAALNEQQTLGHHNARIFVYCGPWAGAALLDPCDECELHGAAHR